MRRCCTLFLVLLTDDKTRHTEEFIFQLAVVTFGAWLEPLGAGTVGGILCGSLPVRVNAILSGVVSIVGLRNCRFLLGHVLLLSVRRKVVSSAPETGTYHGVHT